MVTRAMCQPTRSERDQADFQALTKEGKDAQPSVVERKALSAIQTKSHVRRWARMKSPMLLSLGYVIGWYLESVNKEGATGCRQALKSVYLMQH